jgi:TRAP-type uncharacterized transport system substrate-binding protein
MLRLSRWLLFIGLIAILCIAGVGWVALDYFIPAPPSEIAIGTAFKGASFDYYGQRYRERFSRANVKLEPRETAGAVENLELLQDPNSGIQIAFVTGGVSDGNHSPGLLSLGTIYNIPYWVFYASIEPLDRLSQLKGKRIAVGPVGSGTRHAAEKILRKGGVNAATATLLPFAGNDAVDALRDGKVDVVWIIGAPYAPAIQALLTNPSVRLMTFPMAEAFIRIFPDLVRLVLPQGVFDIDRVIPPNDVPLIGTTTRVLIRNDLHPAIVHLLLKTMIEEHGGPEIFQRSGEFPTSTDAEYPMAASAVDYYKNGPSFMQRHLPLWLTVYVQRAIALLVTGIAIGIPAFNFAPKLYLWLVRQGVLRLYGRLRLLEKRMQTELSPSQVIALQSDLENIEREAGNLEVPTRFSELFFSLKLHINLTRTRLASRLVEIQGKLGKAA